MNFNRKLHDELCKRLVDQGKIIESAFPGLRLGEHPLVPATATAEEIENAKLIFMAGAQHLFGSIIAIMDQDREPTDRDLARMDAIDQELKGWTDLLKLRVWKAEGTA